MKRLLSMLVVIVWLTSMFAGCGKASDVEATVTEAPAVDTVPATEEPSTEPAPTETEADVAYEGDAASYYIDEVYHEQIARYATALSEQWEEGKYFENELSALPYYYYEGNPLENVGFGFVDLDNDGYWELVIGAILNADKDPSVFEIWTLVDGEPVMLAQGGTRNRYVLEYVEEDGMWYVVNEGSGSAFSHVTYYLTLNEGKFEVVQGIMFDASADEENPWFLTYDQDWDVSNDAPIDEATANAILETNRAHYTALEYFPYIFFH